MIAWLAVFIGGGMGSLARYAIGLGVKRLLPTVIFPWATLSANLLATAFLAWLILRAGLHTTGKDHWHALLAIGFCGGFSTMSAFNAENHQLLNNGLYLYAALNILLTVVGGVLLFLLFARST